MPLEVNWLKRDGTLYVRVCHQPRGYKKTNVAYRMMFQILRITVAVYRVSEQSLLKQFTGRLQRKENNTKRSSSSFKFQKCNRQSSLYKNTVALYCASSMRTRGALSDQEASVELTAPTNETQVNDVNG